jgi:hypothetical protein
MKSYIFLCSLIISINHTVLAQNDSLSSQTSSNVKKEVNNYFSVGLGAADHYFNFGGGLFYSVGDRILLGVRGNGNIETTLFISPGENFRDVEATARYVPFIWNRMMISVGCGIGYGFGQKRGNVVTGQTFLVPEYEKETYSSITGLFEADMSLFLSKSIGISVSSYSLITNDKTYFRFQIGLFLCKIQ